MVFISLMCCFMPPAASCCIFCFGNYSPHCSCGAFPLESAPGHYGVFPGYLWPHFLSRSSGPCTLSTARRSITSRGGRTVSHFFLPAPDGCFFCAHNGRRPRLSAIASASWLPLQACLRCFRARLPVFGSPSSSLICFSSKRTSALALALGRSSAAALS